MTRLPLLRTQKDANKSTLQITKPEILPTSLKGGVQIAISTHKQQSAHTQTAITTYTYSYQTHTHTQSYRDKNSHHHVHK